MHKPILNVYIIWHPDAEARCQPLATALYSALNSNPDTPFARGIGIPVYFRCHSQADGAPLAINRDDAKQSVMFVLIEENFMCATAWKTWLTALYHANTGEHLIVPVALSKSAFHLQAAISKTHFVSLHELEPAAASQHLQHQASHILGRLLENTARTTKQGIALSPLPIRLFISYTQRCPAAEQLAWALKHKIDDSQVERFFAAANIASGHDFPKEIEGHIEHSALIAIRSDHYSSSPWCQMEVMAAKRLKRPMVVVDALQNHEPRSFPYLSNVPVLRVDLQTTPNDTQLQAIIDFALLEVLRFYYVKRHFAHLKASDWLPKEALILSRPPEDGDLKTNVNSPVVYPDPPLGYAEINELNHYQTDLVTPTTVHGKDLQDLAVGISISEPDANELKALGLSHFHLQSLMLDVARQCLAQGAQLLYGGDLRPNGFTENLLALVRHHNDTLNKAFAPVVNYLAWPLQLSVDKHWEAKHMDALSIIRLPAPVGLADSDSNSPLVWAQSLTEMREAMVKKVDARIMLGGKTLGFKGKYPGLVEEALLTLKAGKPLYLLGGFGGTTRVVIEALQGLNPKQLTETEQCKDSAYKGFVAEYNQRINNTELAIDYQAVTEVLAGFGIAGLNNGLSLAENQRLFVTINHEEAIGLVLKGLSFLGQHRFLAATE